MTNYFLFLPNSVDICYVICYIIAMTPRQLERIRQAQNVIESRRSYPMVVAKNSDNGRWECVERVALLDSHSWVTVVHSESAGRARLCALNSDAELARFTATNCRSAK